MIIIDELQALIDVQRENNELLKVLAMSAMLSHPELRDYDKFHKLKKELKFKMITND